MKREENISLPWYLLSEEEPRTEPAGRSASPIEVYNINISTVLAKDGYSKIGMYGTMYIYIERAYLPAVIVYLIASINGLHYLTFISLC